MKIRFLTTINTILALCMIALMLPTLSTAEQKTIILATTTSTQDSGLLDALLPIFEKNTGYFVKTISVGSGAAIKMGEKGEADVLLVHSPDAEKKFIDNAYGINRKLVMHNDFVIVGPKADTAKIKGEKTAVKAFKKISEAGALFLTRADKSGTHALEQKIWKASAINPENQKWYQQTGLGMGQTLNISTEKNGYTISDRGTYLALKKKISLDILSEGDPILLNIYHVIQVNPAKWPKVNAEGAKVFAEFMISKEAQSLIQNFGKDRFGSPLFYQDAGKKEEDLVK